MRSRLGKSFHFFVWIFVVGSAAWLAKHSMTYPLTFLLGSVIWYATHGMTCLPWSVFRSFTAMMSLVFCFKTGLMSLQGLCMSFCRYSSSHDILLLFSEFFGVLSLTWTHGCLPASHRLLSTLLLWCTFEHRGVQYRRRLSRA